MEACGDGMSSFDRMLDIALNHVGDAAEETERLKIYKEAIHHMCSVRYENVDDYIMIAKQAVADYEDGQKHGFAGKKRLARSRFTEEDS